MIEDVWSVASVLVVAVAAVAAAIHAILTKKDPPAAVGWVGLILLVPLLGTVLYSLLGINRIRRRALKLRPRALTVGHRGTPEPVLQAVPEDLRPLVRLVDRVTAEPLTSGNSVILLRGGGEAYRAMLEAIAGAKRSVALVTYIYDNDAVGQRFADALAAATERGVEVRVLIDAAGVRYTFPPIVPQLRAHGVRVELFLPPRVPLRLPYVNLRNHRKIMVVDGSIGFTGGMNIRAGHEGLGPDPIEDAHFCLRGPVVHQMMEVFAEDWVFCCREELQGKVWYPELPEAGSMLARGIPDGPDHHIDKLPWTLQGALACAQRRVSILTPYFLPDQTLIASLGTAAMRGIEVDILLPERGNLLPVQWAAESQLDQVLLRGCRVWLTPEPFDHTKLMLVDDVWVLLGSTNWDPRSLRLNFEFNVECYSAALGSEVAGLVDSRRAKARELTLAELHDRHPLIKLRNGVARLGMPYL